MDDINAVLEYNAKAVYHPLRCADGMALNNIQFAQKTMHSRNSALTTKNCGYTNATSLLQAKDNCNAPRLIRP